MAEGGVISNQDEQLFHYHLMADHEIALQLDLEETQLNDKAIANEFGICSGDQEVTPFDFWDEDDCNDEFNVTCIFEDDDSEIRGGYRSNINKDRKLAEQIQLEFDAESARQLQVSISGTHERRSLSHLQRLRQLWHGPSHNNAGGRLVINPNQSHIPYSARIGSTYNQLLPNSSPDSSPDDPAECLTDITESEHETGFSRLRGISTNVFPRRWLTLGESERIQTDPFTSRMSISAVSEDVGWLHLMNTIHTGRRPHNDDIEVDGLDYEELWDMEERLGEVKFRGMSESEIKFLPECLFDPRLCEKDGEDSCSICMEKYSTDTKVRILKCNHIYHTACIDPWLKNKAECPVCRVSVKDMLVRFDECE